MLINRGWGEDGTEFSPFSSVSGAAEAERCQAGHVTLPALRTCRQFSSLVLKHQAVEPRLMRDVGMDPCTL
jgi:hypothetical protein